MIKVSLLYPNGPDAWFDMEYYCAMHMKMAFERLNPKSMAVERGLSGGELGSPAKYVAMGHLYFDSVDAARTAFSGPLEELRADMPNYTNIKPEMQISEVEI